MPFHFILNKYENLCLIVIKAFDKLHTLLVSIHLLKGHIFPSLKGFTELQKMHMQ